MKLICQNLIMKRKMKHNKESRESTLIREINSKIMKLKNFFVTH